MKILLIGEYSNVHATLAEGLRHRGHEVTVVSDGDGWKNYPRDIDITRRRPKKDKQNIESLPSTLHPLPSTLHSLLSTLYSLPSTLYSLPSTLYSLLSTLYSLTYLWRIIRLMPRLKGYDVVQIINPMMLELKAERQMWFYNYLRKNNRSMVMGAFGMDYYWVRTACDCTTFRYSDFNIGSQLRIYPMGEAEKRDWMHGAKGKLNIEIANDCDKIVAGLYEYHISYFPHFKAKTHFIPMPIVPPDEAECAPLYKAGEKIRFFIGIQKSRNEYKGTDIMLRALQRLAADYPDMVDVRVAENVPFEEYKRMIGSSHVLLDQLYGYTPGMNALLAMSKRMIVVGGAEPENYAILGENELRPIVNVQPYEEDVYKQMRDQLVLHPERIATMQQQSREYIIRHHETNKIAEKYEAVYQQIT